MQFFSKTGLWTGEEVFMCKFMSDCGSGNEACAPSSTVIVIYDTESRTQRGKEWSTYFCLCAQKHHFRVEATQFYAPGRLS